jgi:AhpD family alkylhydroperoxidase
MLALQSLGKCLGDAGERLPLELAMMRASQINRCSACAQVPPAAACETQACSAAFVDTAHPNGLH